MKGSGGNIKTHQLWRKDWEQTLLENKDTNSCPYHTTVNEDFHNCLSSPNEHIPTWYIHTHIHLNKRWLMINHANISQFLWAEVTIFCLRIQIEGQQAFEKICSEAECLWGHRSLRRELAIYSSLQFNSLNVTVFKKITKPEITQTHCALLFLKTWQPVIPNK